MKVLERSASAAAVVAAISALVCCLPFGLVGALGFASVGAWVAPLRPWLLGAAVVLLLIGFWELYYRRNQCDAKRSRVSVALFWFGVIVVILVTIFPQLIANWIAG